MSGLIDTQGPWCLLPAILLEIRHTLAKYTIKQPTKTLLLIGSAYDEREVARYFVSDVI